MQNLLPSPVSPLPHFWSQEYPRATIFLGYVGANQLSFCGIPLWKKVSCNSAPLSQLLYFILFITTKNMMSLARCCTLSHSVYLKVSKQNSSFSLPNVFCPTLELSFPCSKIKIWMLLWQDWGKYFDTVYWQLSWVTNPLDPCDCLAQHRDKCPQATTSLDSVPFVPTIPHTELSSYLFSRLWGSALCTDHRQIHRRNCQWSRS